jgi:hypothetical protein
VEAGQRAAVAYIAAALAHLTDADRIRRLVDGAACRFTIRLGRDDDVELYDHERDTYVTGRGDRDRYLLFDYGTWDYVDLEPAPSGFVGVDHGTGERFSLMLEPGRVVLLEHDSGRRAEYAL